MSRPPITDFAQLRIPGQQYHHWIMTCAWQEGRDAARDGEHIRDCPYYSPETTGAEAAWVLGYLGLRMRPGMTYHEVRQ